VGSLGLGELFVLLIIGALCVGVPAVIVLVIVSSSNRQGKMGINLRAVACPKCQTPQPTFRKSANFRQMLWGGWTCAQCGTELDKWGQPTARG
jgi:hypothetical protein